MRKCRPGLMEYAMESIFKNICYLEGALSPNLCSSGNQKRIISAFERLQGSKGFIALAFSPISLVPSTESKQPSKLNPSILTYHAAQGGRFSPFACGAVSEDLQSFAHQVFPQDIIMGHWMSLLLNLQEGAGDCLTLLYALPAQMELSFITVSAQIVRNR